MSAFLKIGIWGFFLLFVLGISKNLEGDGLFSSWSLKYDAPSYSLFKPFWMFHFHKKKSPSKKLFSTGLKKQNLSKVFSLKQVQTLDWKTFLLKRDGVEQFSFWKWKTMEYLRWRRGLLESFQREKLYTTCLSSAKTHPFCPFIVSILKKRNFKKKSMVSKKTRFSSKKTTVFKMALSLAVADLYALENVSVSSLHKAMEYFSTWTPLKAISQKALRMWGCPSVSLLFALGFKSEEYFPNTWAHHVAYALYQKAMRCDQKKTISGLKARYRLALFALSQNRCDVASLPLHEMVQSVELEYRMRALFWLTWCARKQGNKKTYLRYVQQLRKESPFSFFSLVFPENRHFMKQALKRNVSFYFSSLEFFPKKVSQWVKMLDYLFLFRAFQSIREIFKSQINLFLKSPPFLKLYLAALAARTGEKSFQFQLVSSALYENISLVSMRSMKLLFPLKFLKYVTAYASEINPWLVMGLIRQESAFQSQVRSHAGAVGLMQLLPQTAWNLGRVPASKLMMPQVNIQVGVQYLKKLLKRFDESAELALAAYNAGEEKVTRWQLRYPTKDLNVFLEQIPFSETRAYVPLILRNVLWYRFLYSKEVSLKTTSLFKIFSVFER